MNDGFCVRCLLIIQQMSVPSSFNPSDYEYLLKSLTDGNLLAKAESLKRFNTLVISDKKQFSVYAKRVVLALQELMFEQKEEINLLAAMLVLEIINLNPKDIEYYIRTKLLKQVVVNLGDPKPQLRKTSHYCLLAFVKTYKHIDQVISFYLDNGISSPQPQLRQKCINSFQSIVITETKYLNWASPEFKRLFEVLLQKLKDQNPYVQKAAQQCLLTLSRMDEVKTFIKKLSPAYYSIYKLFYQSQKEFGGLTEIKIDASQKMGNSHKSLLNATPAQSNRSIDKGHFSHQKTEKMGIGRQDSINKQAIIDRIEQIRRNALNPKPQDPPITQNLPKKSESLTQIKEKQGSPVKQKDKLPPFTSRQQKKKQVLLEKEIKQKPVQPPARIAQSLLSIPVSPPKTQKVQNIFGKKVLQDLKNQKDWKIRLEAIQQLQAKFQLYKQSFEMQSLIKMFVPILIRLLADSNFKIAFIALKIIQEILKMPLVKLEVIVPQVLQKLSDNKVALRQNVSKLVRSQYLNSNNRIWIDSLIEQLRKNAQSSFRQELLNILTRLYEERAIDYPFERVVEQVCPLMDDAKTKIKIRTLDLLVLITVQTQRVDSIKSLLMNKLNQVYYEMFIEKVTKQMKAVRATPSQPEENSVKQSKSVAFPSLKKNKVSANNSTSSSLQKYAKTVQAKPITRTSSFIEKQHSVNLSTREKRNQSVSLLRQPRVESIQLFSTRNLQEEENLSDLDRGNLTPTQSVRKKPLKNYKKKLQRTLQSKLMTNYTSDSNQGLRPLGDPQKELKNVLVDIKSDDWQTANESLIKLRRIIMYHSEFLNVVIVKSLVGDIMRHVESLRSSLAKSAVITINELSNATRKALDSQLDMIFNKLMRKTLDANSFISEQVKKALISVSCNSNQSKVVTLLTNFHTSRSIPVKQNIVYILEAIIRIAKVYEKQIQRIIQILVAFMGQGAIEIREKTKPLLIYVIEKEKVNSKVYKMIPSDLVDKLKRKDSIIEKKQSIVEKKDGLLEKSDSIQLISVIKREKEKEPQQLAQIPSASPRKKRKIINFPQQFSSLQQLTKKCDAAEWKVRLQTLVKLVDIAQAFPQEICQHKMGVRVMDIISKQLNDPNSKVATNALTLFKDLAPKIPRLIEANLSMVVNELFSCFASQKTDIRENALELFDLIVEHIEKWMLVQHLCNGVLYGPIRSKASILVKLLKVLPESFRERKTAIGKNVYNMVNKVAEDAKPEIVPILKEIVTISLNFGGDDALSALKQQAKSLAE